jgi:TonB family protein
MPSLTEHPTQKSVILLISVIFHLLLLYKANHWYLATREVPQQQAINIHFHIHAAPQKEAAPTPQPKKIITPKKEPQKKISRPKPRPEKTAPRKVKKAPEPMKRIAQPLTPAPIPQPVEKTVSAEQTRSPIPAPQPVSRETLRNQYLSKFLIWVEQNKRYPGYARQRRIEGDVEVRFQLSSELKITKLAVTGGHITLRRAARDTLFNSGPLPEPPKGIGFPINIRYKMRFSLISS